MPKRRKNKSTVEIDVEGRSVLLYTDIRGNRDLKPNVVISFVGVYLRNKLRPCKLFQGSHEMFIPSGGVSPLLYHVFTEGRSPSDKLVLLAFWRDEWLSDITMNVSGRHCTQCLGEVTHRTHQNFFEEIHDPFYGADGDENWRFSDIPNRDRIPASELTGIELMSIIHREERKKQKVKCSGQMLPSLRFDVLKRDKYSCQICGAVASDGVKLEVDHKNPKSKGGDNSLENLWTLCFDCNRGKGIKLL